MTGDIGERFATAIAQRDIQALDDLLAPDVDFRGLTQSRAWEAQDPVGVLDVVFGNWFEDSDHVEAFRHFEAGQDVGDVRRMGYRFDVTNPEGAFTVEQQAFYRVHDDRLTYLRIMCSGFQPRVT